MKDDKFIQNLRSIVNNKISKSIKVCLTGSLWYQVGNSIGSGDIGDIGVLEEQLTQEINQNSLQK